MFVVSFFAFFAHSTTYSFFSFLSFNMIVYKVIMSIIIFHSWLLFDALNALFNLFILIHYYVSFKLLNILTLNLFLSKVLSTLRSFSCFRVSCQRQLHTCKTNLRYEKKQFSSSLECTQSSGTSLCVIFFFVVRFQYLNNNKGT